MGLSRDLTARNLAGLADHDKVAWSVKGWCAATSLGSTTVHGLIAAQKIRSVKAGKKRLIITTPAEYIAGLRGA